MKLNCKMNALLICKSMYVLFCACFIFHNKKMQRKRNASTLQHTYLKCFIFKRHSIICNLFSKEKKNQALLSKFINIFMYVVKNSHGISI